WEVNLVAGRVVLFRSQVQEQLVVRPRRFVLPRDIRLAGPARVGSRGQLAAPDGLGGCAPGGVRWRERDDPPGVRHKRHKRRNSRRAFVAYVAYVAGRAVFLTPGTPARW